MTPMQVRRAGTGPAPGQDAGPAPDAGAVAIGRPTDGPARRRLDGAAAWLRANRTTIALHLTVVLVTLFVIRVVGLDQTQQEVR